MSCLCSTVVGIRGIDGVIFGVERLVQSKLYEDTANKRIFHIDLHIGMVIESLAFITLNTQVYNSERFCNSSWHCTPLK